MTAQALRLPHMEWPALALSGAGPVLARPSGEAQIVSAAEARAGLASGDVLVCHAVFTAQRLNVRATKPLFDVLELFAFVRPGEPCLPSPLGLARALGLQEPASPEDYARLLHKAAVALMDHLLVLPTDEKNRARKTAAFM